MAGQSTGERVPGKKYRQVVEAAAVGDPINRIARNLQLSWPTVRAIIQRESRDIAERKQELLVQSLRIARRAANRIEEQLDEANLSQANFVYGTATDKIGQLSGDPALIIHHEHQHLHAHAHHFQAFTRDNIKEILDALPVSSLTTPIDSSSSQIQETINNSEDIPAKPVAAAALPLDAAGMHSHSQTDTTKKD